jgi:hypothetical protein
MNGMDSVRKYSAFGWQHLAIGAAVGVTLLALLALAPFAGASALHRQVLRGRVCDQPVFLYDAHRYPGKATGVTVDAWANGQRLLGVVRGRSIYLLGASMVVQADVNTRRFAVRAVRTVSTCASLRVVFEWGARSVRHATSKPQPSSSSSPSFPWSNLGASGAWATQPRLRRLAS